MGKKVEGYTNIANDCALCHKDLVSAGSYQAFKVFKCGHNYHKRCIESADLVCLEQGHTVHSGCSICLKQQIN